MFNNLFKSFANRSLQFKLGSVLLSFLLLGILNYLSVNFFKQIQETDTGVVDAAGRQRMLSQRIAFYSEQIMRGQDEVKGDLKSALRLCNTSLIALKEGGVAPGIANEKVLPPTSKNILPTVLKAEDLWNEYRKNANILIEQKLYLDTLIEVTSMDTAGVINHTEKKSILNPKTLTAITFIEQNAGEMLVRFNNMVKRYVEESNEKQSGLGKLLLSLLSLNILMVGVGFYITNKFIKKPIWEIINYIKHLSKGDLTYQINHSSNDEIGTAIQNLGKLEVNLRSASKFAMEIGNGQFESDFVVEGDKDQLGLALLEMRDRLFDISKEDQKRNWVSEGLAKFGDILRNNQGHLEGMTDKILAYVVKYLEANQGVMFIVNDDEKDNPYLEMVSYYAWGNKKFLKGRVEKGEGLAGRAWIEQNTVYLKEVPNDYVKITSGLGDTNPKSILVVPLKLNEEIYGIIEIASLNVYESYQIEFVEKLAENVASTISTLRVNERTRRLLEQTQQQTEEMRAQEEEMRQNMEELTATQEEMQRKEKEYLEKINELENRSH
ncbi:type IV pili methyl-accepting chemotaxis transducer N-terminal domain-containing protein [Fulvivirga sediminis]|uniref:Type IV pili methyl-accepting chemotaxis transducer N-terminal domain-containing protein n=1 Tax=Fulvivirga sediminis TaxID=2803949 RepID=A0A937K176_9BACT|nr:type IV pili methyl-accepting chemotaxis transducer N-terminal domain-containing protein [Fulvivirga sediminis]MBL3657161.1 type IV pili methyl-accepting chemotaxis transducer N-terminal domain-containing protein [Fulvivirga sediminis]